MLKKFFFICLFTGILGSCVSLLAAQGKVRYFSPIEKRANTIKLAHEGDHIHIKVQKERRGYTVGVILDIQKPFLESGSLYLVLQDKEGFEIDRTYIAYLGRGAYGYITSIFTSYAKNIPQLYKVYLFVD